MGRPKSRILSKKLRLLYESSAKLSSSRKAHT
jgi:hypothetical protein